MRSLIAAERRAVRAPKVRNHKALLRAGRKKSVVMAKGGKFAHNRSMPWAKGRAGGQNLAMGSSAAQAFTAMRDSAAHRRIMRDRDWRFAGVGAARDCEGLVFFTVNFLAPRR